MFTRQGPLELRVYVTAQGYAAELLDGSLSAFGSTEDEAVARLALAVAGRSSGDGHPNATPPRP